jgi:hypothetical protein
MGHTFTNSKGHILGKAPSVNNYNKNSLIECLIKYQPDFDSDGKDEAFLEKIHETIKRTAWLAAEDNTTIVSDLWTCIGWKNLVPWIRLIHVLTDDDMKIWFQKKMISIQDLRKTP